MAGNQAENLAVVYKNSIAAVTELLISGNLKEVFQLTDSWEQVEPNICGVYTNKSNSLYIGCKDGSYLYWNSWENFSLKIQATLDPKQTLEQSHKNLLANGYIKRIKVGAGTVATKPPCKYCKGTKKVNNPFRFNEPWDCKDCPQ